MATAGEKYLSDDIARKAQLISDLINQGELLVTAADEATTKYKEALEVLTPTQKKKLGLE